MTTLEKIDEFLEEARVAIVGISRNEKDFTNLVFKELLKRGYDPIPVNPNASEIGGQKCYARVQDIQPPVKNAILFTSPTVTDQVVVDCAQSGIKRVWMHRGAGVGAVSKTAIQYCREKQIEVIAGYCPYMFLPHAGLVHRLHGIGMKLIGSYPKEGKSA